MKIYIGADHQGFHLKNDMVFYLQNGGYEVVDEGDRTLNPADDFPQFAGRVVNAMLASGDRDARGILICGSGQGMCMAANRHKGIRAALGWDVDETRSSRSEDDSNVLCLPASALRSDRARVIVSTWLETPFAAAPRYIRRLAELDKLG